MGGFAFWGAVFLVQAHQMTTGDADTIFGYILAGTGLVATLVGGFIATALRKRSPAGYVWLMAFFDGRSHADLLLLRSPWVTKTFR